MFDVFSGAVFGIVAISTLINPYSQLQIIFFPFVSYVLSSPRIIADSLLFSPTTKNKQKVLCLSTVASNYGSGFGRRYTTLESV
jgi:hypothetical protein